MRLIKFRGKTECGEWVYGPLVMSAVYPPYICWADDASVVVDAPVIMQDSIGQYTGLKDYSGIQIFEGDIVMSYVVFTDEDEITREFWRVGEICFVAGAFWLTNCTNYDDTEMKIKSDIQPSKKSKYNFPAYRSQILGNIHDNPELLKGSKL